MDPFGCVNQEPATRAGSGGKTAGPTETEQAALKPGNRSGSARVLSSEREWEAVGLPERRVVRASLRSATGVRRPFHFLPLPVGELEVQQASGIQALPTHGEVPMQVSTCYAAGRAYLTDQVARQHFVTGGNQYP